MPRKRSKSPKHKTRPRSKSKKTKSRSKSKNRKYGGDGVFSTLKNPTITDEKESKYGLPVNIHIQKWFAEGTVNYQHPAYLEYTEFVFNKKTIKNIYPSYIELLPYSVRGEQKYYTITKQWRVGNENSFTFRIANKNPDNNTITRDLQLKTYQTDFPCFIAYNLSNLSDNNLNMYLKVYNLGENGFHIYKYDDFGSDPKILKIINNQGEFLNFVNDYLTNYIKHLTEIKDLRKLIIN